MMTLKTVCINFVFSCFYYVFRIFSIQPDKIFFQNFNGRGYGDNPKYIAEEIIRRGLRYKLVWAARKQYAGNFPKEITVVHYKSIRSIYEASTAGIWIDNCRKQIYERKRENQYYIQTWHGEIYCGKKLEKDVESQLSRHYVKQAKYDSRIADLFLSPSKIRTQIYKSSFWYNGEIMASGSPRDDILINNPLDMKGKVQNYYSINKNKKIVLYAPTFRNNFDAGVFNLDYESVLNTLRKQTEEDWVFLVRLHPNIANELGGGLC